MAPLFGSGVALLAAWFYASSPPQLTHAKELVQIITGQFFQLAGMCLLVRGIAGRRTRLVVSAGLPLAACIYTYHSARLAPLVAVVYVLAVFWERRRAGLKGFEGSRVRGFEQEAIRVEPLNLRTLEPAPRQGLAFAAALMVFTLSLIPAVQGCGGSPRHHAASAPPRSGRWCATAQPVAAVGCGVADAVIFHYQQGPSTTGSGSVPILPSTW